MTRLYFNPINNLNHMSQKRVYTFGNGLAEGKADMRNLLGGKGANLAEMNLIGVPVPPGFTITTLMNSKFGDVENPLLVSVRSGARASMPGMMDTILNLGLNDEVVEGMIRKTGNARFAWDSYRRFVQMYGDVVLGMKPVNKEDIDPFEAIIEEVKEAKGVKLDNELEVADLQELVKKFKAAVKEQTGKDFPNDSYEQLWGAICAVFDSWMNDRAILYRKMEGIPAEWGTAVNVQAMVFGNMGDTSATGVCFSRDAGNGENLFTHRVRTLLPVSAHLSRLPRSVLSAGQSVLVSPRRSALPSIPLWKRLCPRSTRNSTCCRTSWRTTTATCRIWSSPYRKASCGSCRHVTASAQVLPWLRLPWTSYARALSTRRPLFSVASPTSWTSFCTPYLTRLP